MIIGILIGIGICVLAGIAFYLYFISKGGGTILPW